MTPKLTYLLLSFTDMLLLSAVDQLQNQIQVACATIV
jgi:hypothetical protein